MSCTLSDSGPRVAQLGQPPVEFARNLADRGPVEIVPKALEFGQCRAQIDQIWGTFDRACTNESRDRPNMFRFETELGEFGEVWPGTSQC